LRGQWDCLYLKEARMPFKMVYRRDPIVRLIYYGLGLVLDLNHGA
jgi:hypothetical protein